MSNEFLNWLVKELSAVINEVIQDLLPEASKAIDMGIDELNKMVAGETPYTFVSELLGDNLPLNLTLTRSPIVEGDTIDIQFDGRFVKPENCTSKIMLPPSDIANFNKRFPGAHSE